MENLSISSQGLFLKCPKKFINLILKKDGEVEKHTTNYERINLKKLLYYEESNPNPISKPIETYNIIFVFDGEELILWEFEFKKDRDNVLKEIDRKVCI